MSIKTLAPDDKKKWDDLIQTVSVRSAHNFTHKSLAKYLNVSRNTIIELEKGNIYDVSLLFAYAVINGYNINFNLENL